MDGELCIGTPSFFKTVIILTRVGLMILATKAEKLNRIDII